MGRCIFSGIQLLSLSECTSRNSASVCFRRLWLLGARFCTIFSIPARAASLSLSGVVRLAVALSLIQANQLQKIVGSGLPHGIIRSCAQHIIFISIISKWCGVCCAACSLDRAKIVGYGPPPTEAVSRSHARLFHSLAIFSFLLHS